MSIYLMLNNMSTLVDRLNNYWHKKQNWIYLYIWIMLFLCVSLFEGVLETRFPCVTVLAVLELAL